MTANSNCGSNDTCTDTPQWTTTGNTSEIYLYCNPCINQTVYAEARSASYQDILLSVSFGGFTSDPMPFTVYAPYEILCCRYVSDNAMNDGFETDVGWQLYDQFSDVLTGLALNESFTATDVPDFPGFSGWGTPEPYGIPAGWGAAFSDSMGEWNGCMNATPECTNPQLNLNPTEAMHNNQSWQAGNSVVGLGLQVRTDTQQFYVDHARYTYEISPTSP